MPRVGEEVRYRLYCMNCLDLFPKLAPASIDLVLCDPPYGTTQCKWDSVIPLGPMWAGLKRVSKPIRVVVLMAAQPYASMLISSNITEFKYEWIWKKSKGCNFTHAPNMPLKIHEIACVFSSSPIGHVSLLGGKRMPYFPQGVLPGMAFVKQSPNSSQLGFHRESQSNHKNGYSCKGSNYPTSVLEAKSESSTVHPTQKPVALMEYFIKTYSSEGDLILDFAMGSGTTGVACANLGRRFIGCDNNREYFEIAKKRISEAYRGKK